MDIRMPRLDGLAATRGSLDEAGDEPPRVLVLTTFGLDEYVYDALRAGASGFLLKDAPAEDLLAAVRVVARGDALLDPAVTRSVIDALRRASPIRRRARPRELDRAHRRASARSSGCSPAAAPTPRSPRELVRRRGAPSRPTSRAC